MATFKSIFFKIMQPLASALPHQWLAAAHPKVIIPAYHVVSDVGLPHISNLYQFKTTKTFRDDLDFLLKHYQPIDLQTFIHSINDPGLIQKPSFLMTFDDGLRQFDEVVAPILREKGVPAANFLNSAFIDNRALMYRYKASLLIDALDKVTTNLNSGIKEWFHENNLDFSQYRKSLQSIEYHNQHLLNELAGLLQINFDEFLKQEQPYLTTNQIQKLQKQGFEFGAHSIDHPDFRQLSFQGKIQQTSQSMEAIASQFALPYKAFAYPFTDEGISMDFFQTMFEQKEALEVSFGGAGIKEDPFPRNYQRIPMEISQYSGKTVIKLEWLYYRGRKLMGMNQIKRECHGNQDL